MEYLIGMRAETRRRAAAGTAAVLAGLLLALGAACRKGAAGDPSAPGGLDLGSLRPARAFPGRIVFQSDMDGDAEIYLLTNRGVARLTDNDWSDEYPRWSPDGRRIAFAANPGGAYDIFVMNADGTGIARVTDGPHDEVEPAWAPDGTKLAYTEEIKRPFGKRDSLWLKDLATGRAERPAVAFADPAALAAFSPAAPFLAFTGKKAPGWDVFICDLETGASRPLTAGGHACRPRFSPDGGLIAYVSHEADGKGDVWLMAPDGSGQRRLTVRDATSDYSPAWAPDGLTIVFASSADTMYAREGRWALYTVSVATGRAALLFDGPGRDVFPDWRD